MRRSTCQIIPVLCVLTLAITACKTPRADENKPLSAISGGSSGSVSLPPTGVDTEAPAPAAPPVELPPPAVPPAAPPEAQVGWPKSSPSAEAKSLALTGFSQVTDSWGYESDPAVTTPADEFSDAYTRLIILGTEFPEKNNRGKGGDNKENRGFLPYESRSWISRYFVGKNYTTNLTAKVVVGAFEATVPLATVTHQSDRNGEHWSRSIHYNALNFPLFLVRSDGAASIPSITFALNASNEITSQGAAAGLQAALTVARAAGTTTSVITQLSEQATKERARAIDDVVSKLFSNGIKEEHVTDRDLRLWQSKSGKPDGAAVEFSIPSKEGKWDSAENKVGKWIFSFDFPRRSIFSDWRICGEIAQPRCAKSRGGSEEKILKSIDPSSVLNYRLLDSAASFGSIRTYLSQQDWYLTSINGMSASDIKTQISAANNMCRKIRNEITSLGLNAFDADIVLWAVWKSMPLPDNKPDLAKLDDCKKIVTDIDNKRI